MAHRTGEVKLSLNTTDMCFMSLYMCYNKLVCRYCKLVHNAEKKVSVEYNPDAEWEAELKEILSIIVVTCSSIRIFPG